MSKHSRLKKEIFYSPLKLIIIIVISVLLYELIFTLVLTLLPPISQKIKTLIDIIAFFLIFVPEMYFLIFRPLVNFNLKSKKSEEKERNAREFAENLVRTANVIVIGLNKSGEINLLNEAAEKVTGYTFNELKGKNWFEILVPKEKYPYVWEEFISITQMGNTPKTFENPIQTKWGEERVISWQNSLVYEGGKNTGSISFGIDLTERKKAELREQVLHEITNGVTTAANLDELLNLIHQSISKIVYAENCFFALYDQNTGFFSFPFFIDKFDEAPEPLQMPKSCTAYVCRTGKSAIITPQLFQELYQKNEVKLVGSPSPSWIGVPLKTSDKIIGVLVLQHYEKENVYSESNLHFLDSIGSQVANVIERKRAEEELAKSFSLLTATLESTADGILVVDNNGKTTNYNKKFVELWRIPESIIETGDDEQMLSFVVDQLKDPEGFIKKVKELYKNDEEASFDIVEFKDGRTFHRYSKLQIFEGKSVGRVWSFHDISDIKLAEKELKKSEEKFRTFFEKSPIGIEIYDAAGYLIDANIASLEMFGINDKKSSLGFNIFEGTSLTPDLKTKLLLGEPIDYTANFNFDKIRELDQYQTNKQGNSDLLYSITPFKSNNEESIQGYLLLVQDITERMQTEKALKENESRLLELNATKDKFFSIISHDLRSPFNSILGFSNLLLEQVKIKDYEGIEKYAGIINNSSNRAMDLLTNLLEWSRTQTGRMEFNPEFAEIVILINEATELLNDAAKQKSISILKFLPNSAPFFVDKAMFSTIIRNLVSNAIKFTNKKGEIKVSAKIQQNELLISVADNGIGISKENLNNLFKLEKNYSISGTQNEPGTGLGLILCNEFVNKHDGKIWADSEVGKGSTFYFTMKMKSF